MKKLPSRELLEDIALEVGVDSAFIEKDWFAVEVLKVFSSINEIPIVFTGGTSLSKAYALIKRFSEDLDFRIPGINLNRKQNLKLEFSFDDRDLLIESKKIQSFVTQFTSEDKFDCEINTISPLETAADKLCALIWRVDIKDRSCDIGTKENDPTIVRHLHDQAALIPIILADKINFKEIVEIILKKDRNRGGINRPEAIKDLIKQTTIKLLGDKGYIAEYQDFVGAMSYAPDDEKVSFTDGIKSLELIGEIF